MTNNELIIKIVSELSELNANVKSVLSRIENHETRIQNLEQGKIGGIKSEIVALLIKGLIISVVTIGSLTGAAGLITKILGV